MSRVEEKSRKRERTSRESNEVHLTPLEALVQPKDEPRKVGLEAGRLVLHSNRVVARVGRREEDGDGEGSSVSVGRGSSFFGEVKVEEGVVGDGEDGRVGALDELKEKEMVFRNRVGIRRVERRGRRDVQLWRSSDDVGIGCEGSRRLDDADVLNVVEAFGGDLERLDHK